MADKVRPNLNILYGRDTQSFSMPFAVMRDNNIIDMMIPDNANIKILRGSSYKGKWVSAADKTPVQKLLGNTDVLLMSNPQRHRLPFFKHLFRRPLYYVLGTPKVSMINSGASSHMSIALASNSALVKTYSALPLLKFIGPAALGVLAAHGVGEVVEGFIGLSMKAIKKMDDVQSHMAAVEMGGMLGPGFKSYGAATERQRIMHELRNSNVSNRRFLGKEAKLYSGIM